MSRGPCTFKKRDVMQAIKAARAAGLTVNRCEIDRQGKISIISADEQQKNSASLRDWEDVR
jgi:hypothetical protein